MKSVIKYSIEKNISTNYNDKSNTITNSYGWENFNNSSKI